MEYILEQRVIENKDWATILFDQALLAEGGQLQDPAGYVKRINQMLLA